MVFTRTNIREEPVWKTGKHYKDVLHLRRAYFEIPFRIKHSDYKWLSLPQKRFQVLYVGFNPATHHDRDRLLSFWKTKPLTHSAPSVVMTVAPMICHGSMSPQRALTCRRPSSRYSRAISLYTSKALWTHRHQNLTLKYSFAIITVSLTGTVY